MVISGNKSIPICCYSLECVDYLIALLISCFLNDMVSKYWFESVLISLDKQKKKTIQLNIPVINKRLVSMTEVNKTIRI